jgi:hypothetical protein
MVPASRTLFAVVLLASLTACGSSSSVTSGDPPTSIDPATPSPGACRPGVDATGNALHVGAFCSPGGSQCDAYHNASLRCAQDLDPRGGRFCLLLGCKSHADCGPDACCTGDPGASVHACVPSQCVGDGGACPAIP